MRRMRHWWRSSVVTCLRSFAETNSQLDQPLQLNKLHTALWTMQGQRASGVNGLTVEFYKTFWDIVAHDMLEVFFKWKSGFRLPAIVLLQGSYGSAKKKATCRTSRIGPLCHACVTNFCPKLLANRLREAIERELLCGINIDHILFDQVEHNRRQNKKNGSGYSPICHTEVELLSLTTW